MKKDEEHGSFFSLFSGLDKFLGIVSDMVETDKKEVKLSGDIGADGEKKITGKYDFKVKLGPDFADGTGMSRGFDDLFEKKPARPKTAEPAVDIFEDENGITLVAELPGVEKDDIELNLTEGMLTLNASRGEVSYLKKVPLKFSPDPATLQECFSNAIYSVSVRRKT